MCINIAISFLVNPNFLGGRALTKPVSDLNMACTRIPVHIIFGAINDFL